MPLIYRRARPQRTMDRMWRELWLASRGLERFADRNGLTIQPYTMPTRPRWADVCRTTSAGVCQLVSYDVMGDRFLGTATIMGERNA